MATNWTLRGQALLDGKPHLTVKSSSTGPNHIGRPVPKGFRGTEIRDRNPMHDTEPFGPDDRGENSIRNQLVQRGVK